MLELFSQGKCVEIKAEDRKRKLYAIEIEYAGRIYVKRRWQ